MFGDSYGDFPPTGNINNFVESFDRGLVLALHFGISPKVLYNRLVYMYIILLYYYTITVICTV